MLFVHLGLVNVRRHPDYRETSRFPRHAGQSERTKQAEPKAEFGTERQETHKQATPEFPRRPNTR